MRIDDDIIYCSCGARNNVGSVYCTFCRRKLDKSNEDDLQGVAKTVEQKNGFVYFTVFRGFGNAESNERKKARRDLKRAQQLGFKTLSHRFTEDATFRDRMIENRKAWYGMVRLDDLARIPNDYKPMSFEDSKKAGLKVQIWRDQGVEVIRGGSNTARGQKRWNERQWQEWNAWYSTGSSWEWRR